ncbi:MAG TPA: hypothetical protein VI548_13365 [Chitinophagaceae bacterium]|nr:hypothetical protein [Chitinophagaceae bacterium]
MEKPDNKKASSVTIHNKISNNFRELHVDGAYGGVTPKGQFNINFYAERLAIPKATDYKIEDNKLIKIADSEDSKKGIIREFETGVYMTIETAKEIHKWLGDQISNFETQKNKLK